MANQSTACRAHGGEKCIGRILVVENTCCLIGAYSLLNGSPGIHALLFSSAKKHAGCEQRNDDSGAPEG